MGLKHIFISHAGADATIATHLAQHLRDAGHETKVDTSDLGLGENAISFMNQGIENAGTVVILFSAHSADAKWQKLEIDSAVWNEVAHSGGLCIVVRLDDTPVPAILGRKVYGTLDRNDPASVRRLVEDISRASSPTPTPSATMAEALGPTSQNPFRHLRAEFFENRPDLHARTYAPPDALIVGSLEELKPCFLEGSRGTGKSMLLLSLRARNWLLRNERGANIVRIFGFYLKLSRGAICNAGLASGSDWDPLAALGQGATELADIASQEIIVQILESLFSELAYCVEQNLISVDGRLERVLIEAAGILLFDAATDHTVKFDDVLNRLADSHKRIAAFIRRRFIYGERPEVPVATFDLAQLNRVLDLLRRHIPSLKGSMFVVLLDEYENLFPYQQRIVNGFVKLGPPHLSVKVAKKLGSGHNSGTTTGQELQETHDYSRVPLEYDVEDADQRRAYHRLLRHIVVNTLRGQGVDCDDMDRLLPEDAGAEVPEAALHPLIAELCKVTPDQFDALDAGVRRDKWTYYKEAAVYRVLLGSKGRRPDKRFAGFAQLAFLSSGVIRYFQEILGVAYHLTYGIDAQRTRPLVLSPDNQTRAVHFVSRHNLTTLSRNVERYGEDLKYFLLDLGDCLRHKLLHHTSEPEAARLTIEDPERLDDNNMLALKRLLAIATREGVLQTKEGLPAFKPKHGSDPQPSEFNICRIYAPVLEISPRLRWRTSVTCASLLDLVLPDQRAAAMRRLKIAIVRPRPNVEQADFEFPGRSTL